MYVKMWSTASRPHTLSTSTNAPCPCSVWSCACKGDGCMQLCLEPPVCPAGSQCNSALHSLELLLQISKHCDFPLIFYSQGVYWLITGQLLQTIQYLTANYEAWRRIDPAAYFRHAAEKVSLIVLLALFKLRK